MTVKTDIYPLVSTPCIISETAKKVSGWIRCCRHPLSTSLPLGPLIMPWKRYKLSNAIQSISCDYFWDTIWRALWHDLYPRIKWSIQLPKKVNWERREVRRPTLCTALVRFVHFLCQVHIVASRRVHPTEHAEHWSDPSEFGRFSLTEWLLLPV